MKDDPIITKVWITKYALTQGVYTVENVEHCKSINENMISYANERGHLIHFHGQDWHPTESAALGRAEEMRQKKIKSLEKQIEKLKKVKFSVKESP